MFDLPQKRHARLAWRWRRVAAALTAAALTALAAGASAASADAPTAPPPVTVLTHGNAGQDDFFVSPVGAADKYANGPEILDPNGNVVWFHPVPAGQQATDFRTQTYKGEPVLTWWQGTGFGSLTKGTNYIYNEDYQQIAAVNAGNGLSTDGHEFLITPQDTALVLAYTTGTADLTSIGGPPNQTVINGVVQEIDIETGQVLFEWNSADHVPYSESEQPLPASPSQPWDWFHVNAVKLDTDGNLLIDARNTWTFYKVDQTSGNIIWQLGGKASDFKLQAAPGQSLNDAGAIFAWQHDAEALGNNVYTVFDNEAAGTANTGDDAVSEYGLSRTVRIQIDPRSRTATLIGSYNQPEGLTATSSGNAQNTADGGQVISWGSLPYVSKFNADGDLLWNARFPDGVKSYRAYQLPWNPGDDDDGDDEHGGHDHGHGHGHHGHGHGGHHGHGHGRR